MDLRELISASQRLRRQLGETQSNQEAVQRELNGVNEQLRQALEASGSAVTELSEEEFRMGLAELHPEQMTITVAYATRERQFVKEIQLSQGASIEDGINVSGVLESFPEIDLAQVKVGIHGTIKPLSERVQEGNRIEIYRPVEASQPGSGRHD